MQQIQAKLKKKIHEITERTLSMFVTLCSSKINFIWSSIIPKFRIHQYSLIHLRLLTILFNCIGQWVPSASVTHSLFIFLCQLTSANICWGWFWCPLWECSIVPPFSRAAIALHLKDANHPWEALGSFDSCGRGTSVCNLFQEPAELNQV